MMDNPLSLIDDLLGQWESGILSVEDIRQNYSQDIVNDIEEQISALEAMRWMDRDPSQSEYAQVSGESSPRPAASKTDNPAQWQSTCSSADYETFIHHLKASRLLSPENVEKLQASDALSLSFQLVREGQLTPYQARQIAAGKPQELKLGNYTILDVLGEGGMGRVYRARQESLNREVALKILHLSQSSSAIQRFDQEKHVIGNLRHPHIAVAHDAGVEKGLHFLAMELLEGVDFATLIRRTGPLTEAEVVECCLQAAEGLHYAHSKGVLHRDIKPGNIMVDQTGCVKLLDFGLARSVVLPSAGDPQPITLKGEVLGTPDYMSPEQAQGFSDVDARSDIYSLGCTLYALATGKSMFCAEDVLGKLMAHHSTPAPKLPDADLDAIFQRMVMKAPENRFSSVADVLTALRKLRLGSSPTRLQPKVQSFLRSSSSQSGCPVPLSTLAFSVDADPSVPAPTADVALPFPTTPAPFAQWEVSFELSKVCP